MGYSVIDKNFWASLVKKSCQLDHYRPSYDQLKFSQMFGATYDLRRLSELPRGTLNIAKNGVTFLKSTVCFKIACHLRVSQNGLCESSEYELTGEIKFCHKNFFFRIFPPKFEKWPEKRDPWWFEKWGSFVTFLLFVYIHEVVSRLEKRPSAELAFLVGIAKILHNLRFFPEFCVPSLRFLEGSYSEPRQKPFYEIPNGYAVVKWTVDFKKVTPKTLMFYEPPRRLALS